MEHRGKVHRLGIWAVVVALLLLPGLALAQSGEFDPALRAVIGRAVGETAPFAIGTGGTGTGASSVAAPTAPPLVLLPTPTPAPLVLPTPTPAPRATGAPATLSRDGVSVVAPPGWEVEPGFGDIFFDISNPRNDFAAVFLGGGLDFPGLLGVVIIRDQAAAMLGTFMDDTELVSVELSLTPQGVPMVAIEFDGQMMNEPSSGALYVFGPGNTAYLLLGFAPADDWAVDGPRLAEFAANVTFDESLITLVTASEEMYFTDKAETIETVVLPGWHALATDDETFPLVVAEPELRYLLGFGAGDALGADLDSSAEMMRILAEATAGTDVATEIISMLLDSLGGLGEDIELDSSLTAVYPTETGGVLRMVGTGRLDEEISIRIGVYIDMRTEGSLGMIVLGDVAQALAEEKTVLEILAETLVLE